MLKFVLKTCILFYNISFKVLDIFLHCSVINLCMCTYWIILILTLISTLNVPICKIKYQNMIIMQINSICMINCAEHHLPDHHANIIQLSKLPSCIILLFTCISIHTKFNILICNSKYTEYQKKPSC